MPENNPQIIPGAVAPLNHDETRTGEIQPENSRAEKIFQYGGKVFEKFGIKPKRGRGRPKNCERCGKPETQCACQTLPGEAAPVADAVQAAPVAATASPIDAMRVKIFVAGCVGILKGAVGACKSWLRRNATAARIDSNFTDKALAECSPSESDFKEWGDALEVCAIQYGWDFEHMPAVSLGVKTVGIFAPFASLAGEFKKEIARQRAKDEAAQSKQETAK